MHQAGGAPLGQEHGGAGGSGLMGHGMMDLMGHHHQGEVMLGGGGHHEDDLLAPGQGHHHQQIHTYEADYQLYAMGFANKNEHRFRLAAVSKIEALENYVEVLEKRNDGIVRLSKTPHPLPASKLEWIPDYHNQNPDLLATTADYLRLWECDPDTSALQLKHLFSVKSAEGHGGGQSALTAFDWNRVTLNLIGTAATDTTCTIWDIDAMAVKTQLIAHDMDVFDFAWAQSDVQFATASADGSVRLFDLRDLGISTVMYESPGNVPMLRAVWNRQDYHYLAVITMDS